MGKAYKALKFYEQALLCLNRANGEARNAETDRQIRECQEAIQKAWDDSMRIQNAPTLDELKKDPVPSLGRLVLLYADAQCEYRVPQLQYYSLLHSDKREAYQKAIELAVRSLKGKREGKPDTVVSVLAGEGALLYALDSKRAGADHCAYATRWQNSHDIAQQIVSENPAQRVNVLRKEVHQLSEMDLPHTPNLLILDTDHTLLLKQLQFPLNRLQGTLLQPNARVIPCRATVWAQLINLTSGTPYDVSAFDLYLWNGVCQSMRLTDTNYEARSREFQLCSFDFLDGVQPQEEYFEVMFTRTGKANALAYWWEVHLDEENSYSTKPSFNTTWKQMIHFCDINSNSGDTVRLHMRHDTKKFYFDITTEEQAKRKEEESKTPNVNRAKPSISWDMWTKCNSEKLLQYEKAINKAMPKAKSLVLDVGSGNGLLALMAVQAGAERVIACEEMSHYSSVAKTLFARNKAANRITYLSRKANTLTLGNNKDVPSHPSLVIADLATWKFGGNQAFETIFHSRYALGASRALPSTVRFFAQAISLLDRPLSGFDMRTFYVGSWTELIEGGAPFIYLNDVDWDPITEPFEVLKIDFNQPPVQPNDMMFFPRVEHAGRFNAVVMWYEVNLDGFVYSTKPNRNHRGANFPQVLQEYDFDMQVAKGKLSLLTSRLYDSSQGQDRL